MYLCGQELYVSLIGITADAYQHQYIRFCGQQIQHGLVLAYRPQTAAQQSQRTQGNDSFVLIFKEDGRHAHL